MARQPFKKIRRAPGTTADGAIETMGEESEEKVLEHLAEFADQVVVIVEKMQDVVERFAADRYEELAESRRASSTARERGRRHQGGHPRPVWPMGSLFPMSRADLARLVASMDSIANLATGAADRISMRRFSLPPAMNEQLVVIGPGGRGGGTGAA